MGQSWKELETAFVSAARSSLTVGMYQVIVENVACSTLALKQWRQTHFHQGPHLPRSCLQRAKCNFSSLIVKEYLHLYSPKITFDPDVDDGSFWIFHL